MSEFYKNIRRCSMTENGDKEKAKNEFKVQVLETFATLITAAFGLVAALAWNEAIKNGINAIFPTGGDGELIGLFVYAIVVTFVAIIFTILIANSLKKAKAKIKDE